MPMDLNIVLSKVMSAGEEIGEKSRVHGLAENWFHLDPQPDGRLDGLHGSFIPVCWFDHYDISVVRWTG